MKQMYGAEILPTPRGTTTAFVTRLATDCATPTVGSIFLIINYPLCLNISK